MIIRLLLLFVVITNAETEDLAIANELENQLTASASAATATTATDSIGLQEKDEEAKKQFLDGLCKKLSTEDHPVSLDMDESTYISRRAITQKQINYLIDSNFIYICNLFLFLVKIFYLL